MRTIRIFVIVSVALLALAAYWSPDNHVLAELPLNSQASLGALCDIDCASVSTGCSTIPSCTQNSDCSAWSVVCTDTTNNEFCILVTTLGVPCVVTGPHQCYPAAYLTGICNTGTGKCQINSGPIVGNCAGTSATCMF
jgi:hypothetical protein